MATKMIGDERASNRLTKKPKQLLDPILQKVKSEKRFGKVIGASCHDLALIAIDTINQMTMTATLLMTIITIGTMLSMAYGQEWR